MFSNGEIRSRLNRKNEEKSRSKLLRANGLKITGDSLSISLSIREHDNLILCSEASTLFMDLIGSEALLNIMLGITLKNTNH